MSPRERAIVAERAAADFAQRGLTRFAEAARRHAASMRRSSASSRPTPPMARLPTGHVADVIDLASHVAVPGAVALNLPPRGQSRFRDEL